MSGIQFSCANEVPVIDWANVFEETQRKQGASDAEVTRFVAELGLPLSSAEVDEIIRRQSNPWPENNPNHAAWQPFDPSGWWMPDRPLPDSYLSFVRWSDGGEFRNGSRLFQMWGTGLREFLKAYQVPQYMPGVVPFAFNGDGIMYVFDMREPTVNGEYPILAVSAGCLGFGSDIAPRVANNFLAVCRGRFDVARLMNHGAVLTADQWATCSDPKPMLEECESQTRKLRLFACACARRVWHLLDAPFRNAIEVAEQFIDGEIPDKERASTKKKCEAGLRTPAWTAEAAAATNTLSSNAASAAWNGAWFAARAEANSHEGPAWLAAQARQADLIRDIFANPLCPEPVIELNWLTPDVVTLATTIYTKRMFDQVPILGDALEDAGCTDADILMHCRQPTEHVRGCWVVDLLREFHERW